MAKLPPAEITIAKVGVMRTRMAVKNAIHAVQNTMDALDLLEGSIKRGVDDVEKRGARLSEALDDGKTLTASQTYAELLVGKMEFSDRKERADALNKRLSDQRHDLQIAGINQETAASDLKTAMQDQQAATERFINWATKG